MKIVVGVYRIIIDNKSYIGSSINVYRRWEQHKNSLLNGSHDNPNLQKAFNEHGKIEFELLEELFDADAQTLSDRENYYIKKYHAEYNINKATKNTNQKPVYQFDLHGNFVASYSSAQTAALANGISVSNIVHAAQVNEKDTRTAGGYFWRYTKKIEYLRDRRMTNVYVYDIEGNYLTAFESISECIKFLFANIKDDHNGRISRVLRGLSCTYRGYRFSYEKVEKLDNSKLLSIKSWFPVVQIAPDKKTKIKVFETAAIAAREFNVRQSSEITYACSTGRKCRGYYWTRLGTKWSELLESPEGTETTA